MIHATGAEMIVELLCRQGIQTLSGIPGGANLPLYDALARSGRIRHVLARHEQGAGFIAQGMARVTGRAAVCLATSGPGATNLLTAIADAKLDSVPMVCITGQVPLAMIGTDAFQEVDTYGLSIPVTKHNYLVRSAAELLDVLPQAFAIAQAGRPGPVLIDVPKDVQNQKFAFAAWPTMPHGRSTREADSPGPGAQHALLRAAAMIDAAQRPMLYLGGGVILADASALAVQLAQRCGLPTVMTLMGLGAMPADHPLSLGMLGMHGARATNLALEECDLLIVAGARFDDRATGKVSEFCPRAKVVHIDIDASELGKIKAAHVAVESSCAPALAALATMAKPAARSQWLARVAQLQSLHPPQFPGQDDVRTSYGLIAHAAALAGPDAIVTTDVGQHQMRVAQAYPIQRPRQLLTSGGLGTMGFGLPAAIGAALAQPERRVLCFTGDGSLLMNIQELAVAAEENVNVKVIVMDNQSLGLVRQQQQLFYGQRLYACDFRTRVDFVQAARGLGVPACDLDQSDDPAATLADALQRPGPELIHATIDADDLVYPMVPPGAANRQMIEGDIYANAQR